MAKETVTAVVNYPCYVTIEVDKDDNLDSLREKILQEADNQLEQGPVDPIIHECSIEDLID